MGYGVEGDTFEYVDGKPQFNDKILNNPDGLSSAVARTKYVGFQPCGKYYWERELTGAAQSALDAINTIWPGNADGDYCLPNMSMTAEEGSEFSRIMGDVDTYALEMTTKFITGGATNNYSNGYELDTIAAYVISGVSNLGDVGTVSGIVIGVLIFSVINYGLTFYYQYVALLAVDRKKRNHIVAAVALDIRKYLKKR